MIRRLVPCLFAVVVCLVCASSALAGFGFSSASFLASEEPSPEQAEHGELGAPDVQAGSHPWALTVGFSFNLKQNSSGSEIPDQDVKDVYVELPPGFVGNPTVIPQCSIKQFETQSGEVPLAESSSLFSGASCPTSTQVGLAEVLFRNGEFFKGQYFAAYNLVPPPGAPAQFGISPVKIPTIFRPTVRTGSDYGLTIAAKNITQFERLGSSTVTFWGTPADPSHNPFRGECLALSASEEGPFPVSLGNCATDTSPQPFLTLPTNCSSDPSPVVFRADSWENPGSYNADGTPNVNDPRWASTVVPMPELKGCEHSSFAPSMTAAPDTAAADTPTGLTVDVSAQQDGLLNGTGIAAGDISDAKVVLPEGVAVNPGQAAGLQACQAGEDGLDSEALPSCPQASKVGTVQITSPLLRDKLEGDVYVLQSNPPDLKLLITASADGVNVKLVANVTLDEFTGRVTTTITNAPPLPVSDFRLSFSGGPQAALTTPLTCGSYTTDAEFTPSTAPATADAFSSSKFLVTTGPGGLPCVSAPPFAPVLTAGSTTDQAGGYTDFSLLLQRDDGQQRISSLQFKTPPGLSGMISQVPLCPEPQASQGTCSEASQIGHTTVTAGPGPDPLVIPQPGQRPAPIYLTGAYGGAPYGLSIAVPVVAGPFNLGTEVERASINVDPHTAQLTITTDPSGPHAIPTILDGIPTDLRTINAVIDRPGFMFNPTNCDPSTFNGTATSSSGATAAISSRFQVGSCQSLAFKPAFKVSTSGKTSRKNGASLTATINYANITPAAGQATSQSNIASVKVDLPKQLPSRLTTLQKACLASVFEANPANCPSASLVGHATVHTPILPVPLTGPAYFVSHGGEAFPSLIIVLQGYGVRVDLIGTTFISKQGITSSTFKAVPDVPFTSFQLVLPTGPFSALTANGNLCAGKLAMPTAFNAQDGAVIHQSTPITVTNCPKPKKKETSKAKKAARTSSNINGRSR